MIKTILSHIDFLTGQIEMLDREVAERVKDYQEDIDILDSIPGIAQKMLAKLGTDIKKQFPSASQYVFLGSRCSWNY